MPLDIIVVPHTIFQQWNKAIESETLLKHIIINNKKTLQKFIDILEIEDTQNENHLTKFDCLLISATQYNTVLKKAEDYDTWKTEVW